MRPLQATGQSSVSRDIEVLEALHYLLAPELLLMSDEAMSDAPSSQHSKRSTLKPTREDRAQPPSITNRPADHPYPSSTTRRRRVSFKDMPDKDITTSPPPEHVDDGEYEDNAAAAVETSIPTPPPHHHLHHPIMYCLEGDQASGVRWVPASSSSSSSSNNEEHLDDDYNVPISKYRYDQRNRPPPVIVGHQQQHHHPVRESTNVTNMSHIATPAVVTAGKAIHNNHLNIQLEPSMPPSLPETGKEVLDQHFPNENLYYLQQDAMMMDRLRRDGPNWLSRVGVITSHSRSAQEQKPVDEDLSSPPPPHPVLPSSHGIEKDLIQLMQDRKSVV